MRLSLPPITFTETHVCGPDGVIGSSLRIIKGRIAAVDCSPEAEDTVIRLQGSPILPGLINAHDHLELNNFPRLKWRDCYSNACEWIADFQPRFQTDPVLSSAISVSLKDRLLLGALKNLLCGATTVCHHNPLYRELTVGFPVRVVRRCCYSHSLLIDGESVKEKYQKTPKDWPWIIHAAEGTDASAAGEFTQLDRWNCLGPNTILVHGVGMAEKDKLTLIERGGALVWCPSSNNFLLGAIPDVALLAGARRVALGTDSRLSGERDLLSELKFAASHSRISAADLLRMVTEDAAALLRVPEVGALRPGAFADLVVFPPGTHDPWESLLSADRAKIRLVLLGGRAQLGDMDMLPAFDATRVRWTEVRVDRRPKLMEKTLADRARKSLAPEPGLEL